MKNIIYGAELAIGWAFGKAICAVAHYAFLYVTVGKEGIQEIIKNRQQEKEPKTETE